jgi:hypothetical protein
MTAPPGEVIDPVGALEPSASLAVHRESLAVHREVGGVTDPTTGENLASHRRVRSLHEIERDRIDITKTRAEC